MKAHKQGNQIITVPPTFKPDLPAQLLRMSKILLQTCTC